MRILKLFKFQQGLGYRGYRILYKLDMLDYKILYQLDMHYGFREIGVRK